MAIGTGGQINLHQKRVAGHFCRRDDLRHTPFEWAVSGGNGNSIADFRGGKILLRKTRFQAIPCRVFHGQHRRAGHHHGSRVHGFRAHNAVKGRNDARVTEVDLDGIMLRAGLLLAREHLLLLRLHGPFIGKRPLIARLRSIEFLAAQ